MFLTSLHSPKVMNSSFVNNVENLLVAEEGDEAKSKLMKVVSTLPKEKRWYGSSDLYQYQGFWYPLPILQGILSVQENFKSSPNDIFLCSAPKTGCTWLRALCFAITTRGRFEETNHPLLTNNPHLLIPFLKFSHHDPDSDYGEMPVISTHLPIHALPKSLDDTTKIIYVCREPKDTFISLWHFMQKWPTWQQPSELTTSFEKEFELFCEGKTMWGPYWDHVLGYWERSVGKPDSTLFLKYEELTIDPLLHVKRLADFMGRPFTKDEEGQGVPERIVRLCSFENLRNLEVNKSGKHFPFQIDYNAYFRKGKPGDWKNHLTSSMIERMDNITKEKLRGSSFHFGTTS